VTQQGTETPASTTVKEFGARNAPGEHLRTNPQKKTGTSHALAQTSRKKTGASNAVGRSSVVTTTKEASVILESILRATK
jgi:hypothetical protein